MTNERLTKKPVEIKAFLVSAPVENSPPSAG